MSIFKAYDIRGIYPEQLNEKAFHKIGMVAAEVLQCKTVVVGCDMRVSSPVLKIALIKGLTNAGVNVIDIGMVSTPMLYFAVTHFKTDAGMEITASHNPAEYNGIKFCRADAIPVAYDTGLEAMEQRFLAVESLRSATVLGTTSRKEITKEYISQLLKYADKISPLTVVVDTGNGVMGEFLPALFDKLPCELIPLYFAPDGTFPHHEANPLEPRNLQDLIAKVKETNADLGVAFDGDGDRCIFVDDTGAIVAGDLMTALLAGEILRRNPASAIVYDLRSSRIVAEEITRLGGKALVSRVGHSFIKKLMREQNAAFAGELSGHFYFRELHFTDNAEMAMLALLSEISRSGKKLSALIAPLKNYFATGEINFTNANPTRKIDEIKKHYAKIGNTKNDDAKIDDVKISELDGLTVEFADWWFNLRPSNTEPVIRLNLEANTAELCNEKKTEVEKLIFK